MSKDVKSLLKEARDAIKKKDYASALKLCKAILKQDKENYMALVFLGISLQEIGPADQAPLAFRKAISHDATNILAWNGLLNYYEKNTNAFNRTNELADVYCKLLQVESSERKLEEYCDKLTDCCTETNQSEICKKLYALIKSGNGNEKNSTIFYNCIATISSKITKPEIDLLPIFEEALSTLAKNQKTRTRKLYSDYLQILHKQGKREKLLEEAKNMHLLYEDDILPLEWICKVYNESYIEHTVISESIEDNVKQLCEKLLKIQENSGMGMFTKAVLSFKEGNISEAEGLLRKVISTRPGLLHAWILLTMCCLKLCSYKEAIQSVLKARKLLKASNISNEKLEQQLVLLYIEALSSSSDKNDLQEVIDVCQEELEKSDNQGEILSHLIKAYINNGNIDQANKYISKLEQQHENENPTLTTFLKAKLLQKQQKLAEALQLLQSYENEKTELPEWWLLIGDLRWESGDHEKSLVPYLKAAKLNPTNYLCFARLGRCYEKCGNLEKARRCYENAFKLNNRNEETVIELCKVYRKQENWEAHINLLEHFTTEGISAENRWAFLQLGLGYSGQENYDKAIENLCIATRVDPSNSYCWESLADAYLARGAYISALKCYQKTTEILPDSLYPAMQMAAIKRILGYFVEARSEFENVLSKKENVHYVPALKGLAETCMNQADGYKSLQMIGMARDCAQLALDKITEALKYRSDLSCLWKIAADSCLFIAKLPLKYSCALVLTALAEGINDEGHKPLNKCELYTLAARCYCKSLSLIDDNILLWHDLASCYLQHAKETENKENAEKLYEYALSTANYCTANNPENWQHWNLLGNVYCTKEPKNYQLAQHAYIKALNADKTSSVAWANLGTLYLMLGELVMANKAFSEAQRHDPGYINSWIGQALIAESCGKDEEAMDLFRHTTQLGVHPESGIGYAHWVCSTLIKKPESEDSYVIKNMHAVPVACDALTWYTVFWWTQLGVHPESGIGYAHWVCSTLIKKPDSEDIYVIKNMHAVPVACDALTWYTETIPENSCAWNLLGVLQERMGLKTSTAQAFRKALRFSKPEHRDLVQVNYARTLTKLGDHEQAIKMYKDVKEATFNSGSGLAYALFKNQQYEESYETYESVLQWLTEEQRLQSDLLVALASIGYMFQGPEAAEQLLFQSIKLQPPSFWGLYATLSLGLLHGKIEMSKLVLNELENLKDNIECLPHYATLLCYTRLLQGDYNSALIETSKLVHRHPNQASLWLTLGLLLLQIHEVKKPTKAITKCIQVSKTIGNTTVDVTRVLCLISLTHLLLGDTKNSLKSAQKAVHCYPNSPETWSVLASTVTTTNDVNTQKIPSFLRFISKELSPNSGLEEWLQQQEKMLK